MKTLVVYEFGKSIGGGDFVMFNLASVFSDLGFEVTLAYSSEKMFKKSLIDLTMNPKRYLNNSKKYTLREYSLFYKIPHPYSTYFISSLESKKDDYSILVFSDDLPKILRKMKKNMKTIIYVHYPHALRVMYSVRFGRKFHSNNLKRFIWSIHRGIFDNFYELIPKDAILLVNSLYTFKQLISAYYDTGIISSKDLLIINKGAIETDSLKIFLLNPPVESKEIYKKYYKPWYKKEDLAVFFGAFTRDKDIDMLIEAFKKLTNKEKILSLIMMGFCEKDPDYVYSLIKKIKNMNINNSIKIICNPSRERALRILSKAKFVIHPHKYEPFGIAILEAMAAGCIPIIRKGPNGPWREIIKYGKYGYGFETAEELTELIYDLYMEKTNSFIDMDNYIYINRAMKFDVSNFQERFKEIVMRTLYG